MAILLAMSGNEWQRRFSDSRVGISCMCGKVMGIMAGLITHVGMNELQRTTFGRLVAKEKVFGLLG